ncbi:YoaK family protein [Pseudoxanthomonas sp.]|uniref:YoaK family protein n=1 Tax=Pseudoxanthomonas sp. TaxID=1871049 RepID=UPI002611F7B2|nr:YoaK family protein [Pseudoxanthomonas sp.]WDS35380.1 MAG: YoaK family protein [Pseudoxanthomonas sp.]
MARVGLLLGFVGGFVDTGGFLSLQGLFTAHVTGNFVTLGASLVHGTSGGLAKLLALPLFCMVVAGTRLVSCRLQQRGVQVLPRLLWTVCGLLAVGVVLSGLLGPFHDGDGAGAFWTGMTLVAAMAIQNAASRIHLAKLPPSTMMTGTTTQVMVDLADLLHGVDAAARAAVIDRLKRMLPALGVFALGCAAGACLFASVYQWCLVPAPLLMLIVLLPARRWRALPH